MTIKEALLHSYQALKGSDSPFLDADVLLAHTIKKPREFLYAHSEKTITKHQEEKNFQLLRNRKKGIPLAYLLKNKDFYGCNFIVDKNVLIPRPETELLVERIIKDYLGKKVNIVDIGTGSGCLAVAVKKNLKKARVYACDISQKALEIAKLNAKKNRVKIIFFRSNLATGLMRLLSGSQEFVIMANLPYCSAKKYKKYSPEIKTEPKSAIVSRQGGKSHYFKLIRQIKKISSRISKIYLEVDGLIYKQIKDYCKKNLKGCEVKILRDLANKKRFLIITPYSNKQPSHSWG